MIDYSPPPVQVATFQSVMEDPEVLRKSKQHLALQMGDLLSTLGILATGGVEANPLLKLIPGHPIASVVLPKALILAGGKRALEKTPIEEKKGVKKVLNAANMLYFVLIANNLYQMSQRRK